MHNFVVHLVFHPDCEIGSQLAEAMSVAINIDDSIFNTGIPTLILPESTDGSPPSKDFLYETARCAVIVFTSDKMVIDEQWSNFVGNIWERCSDDDAKRFLPVQISENAFPVDNRLEGTSFFRAYSVPESRREAAVLRWMTIEICRLLQGFDQGKKLPLKTFLSHAKQDLASDPRVFSEISEHLDNTQPVAAWVDSAEIEAGSLFAQEIEQGVSESVLMVLGTRHYGSRPWCRRELLMAKEGNRPFVIIDALEGEESRSFPYDGNAPRMRWFVGGAEQAVNLLLRETLRHYYLKQTLATVSVCTDTVLAAPPELATVVALPQNSHVLYPDPPLGDEEMERLDPLNHVLETPLQRLGKSKMLAGKQIALSISESSDCRRYGMAESQMDTLLKDISLQLLVYGATLVYGGRIGSDGYTLSLFDMVRSYTSSSGLPPVERVHNYVGWPLPNPESVRAKYINEATVIRVERPPELTDLDSIGFLEEPTAFLKPDSGLARFGWAVGMTTMREAQVTKSRLSIRIAMGGKFGPAEGHEDQEAWYLGRIPGVIEEIYLSLLQRQPVLLIGAYGGGTAMTIDLVEGRSRADFSWEYQKRAPYAEEMREIYQQRNQPWIGYKQITDFFAGLGIDGLSEL
ncbi:MAG: TIR domain-containing protein, partial [Granulosicoccus sp.]